MPKGTDEIFIKQLVYCSSQASQGEGCRTDQPNPKTSWKKGVSREKFVDFTMFHYAGGGDLQRSELLYVGYFLFVLSVAAINYC